MAKVRVRNFTISVDGFGAGPDQSLDTPLGVGGEDLHDWMVGTRSWRRQQGMEGGTEGVDDDIASQMFEGIGATIMGRNMFGAGRGAWDEEWKGWWGEDPPYHNPVFVLTHHARASVPMLGGTTFHFVTDGIEAALEQATAAAGGRDVMVIGGASTIRQYLDAGLIDEMHIAIAPIVLGRGERLFEGVDVVARGYECVELTGTPKAAHLRFERRPRS
jgi:dihydrofolate reductase